MLKPWQGNCPVKIDKLADILPVSGIFSVGIWIFTKKFTILSIETYLSPTRNKLLRIGQRYGVMITELFTHSTLSTIALQLQCSLVDGILSRLKEAIEYLLALLSWCRGFYLF